MVFSTIRRLRYVYGAPSIDNFIFKLCYRWTVLLLVAFSFIVTFRLLFGDSFYCHNNNAGLPVKYLDAKCYDSTVYILPAKLIIKKDESSQSIDPPDENFRRYQSYYSWVNLLFLLQAFNFYLPHLLWKSYERGYMYRLTAGVQKYFGKEEKRALELCYLAKYTLVTQGRHKWYTLTYIFFEVWNSSVSLVQTLWLLHFFDVTGVPDFLPHTLETWTDFKNFYFPSEGICGFMKISVSGIMARYQASCQLPLNSLYMKMFLLLHAWYIILTVLCGLVLVYRICLLVPSFRIFVAKLSSPLSERSVLKSVCYRMSYGDWFFLSRMQKVMTDVDFAQLIDKISIVSQDKDSMKDLDRRSSLFEDAMKEFESSNATSPL